MQEVLVSCQRARLRWRAEVGGLKGFSCKDFSRFSFKCFQGDKSCFPWSRNTCSGWMPGKQLHHGEVLLEGGVKGGLRQRPGHRRHRTFRASWNWKILRCSYNSFRRLRLSLSFHFLHFPLRFICSFGSEPVPRGHQQLLLLKCN